MKLDKVFFKDYAQYQNCVQIQGKQPRKRKLQAILLKPTDNFVIYEGFVDVKDYTEKTSEASMKITNLGLCFDEINLMKSIDPSANIIYSSWN